MVFELKAGLTTATAMTAATQAGEPTGFARHIGVPEVGAACWARSGVERAELKEGLAALVLR
jgi:hypothetical protein